MTVLTAAQVAALVKKVGFPSTEWAPMTAICKAESGAVIEKINPHSQASGLWQVHPRSWPQYDVRRLRSDAEYNARAAYNIWKIQGKRAWVAFTHKGYLEYMDWARQGVAQMASVTGSPSLPGGGGGGGGGGTKPKNDADSGPKFSYGPLGPQITRAGRGAPLSAAEATWEPLQGLKILGVSNFGDYSRLVIGEPTFTQGTNTVPNLRFTLADPHGNLIWRQRSVIRSGSRVQYRDLDFRIDTIAFTPGPHGTGQLEISCVDDIVYKLMRLRGARSSSGISAVSWLAQELRLVGVDPNRYLLGEAVPTQSTISRDIPDQTSTTGQSQAANAWTTGARLAKELGKWFFISGRRLVFGSAAFSMLWSASAPLLIDGSKPHSSGLRMLELPSISHVSVGNSAQVQQIVFKVPLNRAKFFRPGVPVQIKNVTFVAGDKPVTYMVTNVTHSLGVDVNGAEITAIIPTNPPKQPPQEQNANSRPSASGTYTSGGGADGQIARFVSLALQQTGKTYVYGGEASPSDPNPRVFDCSELVEWAAARAGISPRVPDGSSAQRAHCARHGTLISVEAGINTKGALLFAPGHVAISLGNGKTIEAMNPSAGVRQGNARGRNWNAAGRIPGAKGYR